MAKKNLADLSSDELYEMARVREEQEAEEEKAVVREKIEELRGVRRDIVARHRKELAAIDSQIRNLGGRAGRAKRRSTSGESVTEQVLRIVSAAKKISTKEIKAELDQQGIVANNLAQTLAYLKRQGKVTSPSRSIYSPA